jgi:hypothetical protein
MMQEKTKTELEWISPPFEPEINLFGLSFKLTGEGWINNDNPVTYEDEKQCKPKKSKK